MEFIDNRQKEKFEKFKAMPLGQEIVDLLTPISDTYDFVCGALVFCETEEQRQKLINEIKTKNLNTFRDISHAVNEVAMGRV